jgi:dihydroorotate dehydrogenase electron transfer subunit
MKQGLFTITENSPLNVRYARLVLSGDTSAILTSGQFADLSLPGFFLRRPFSVCDWDERTLTLIYESVGKGTRALRTLPVGTRLDLLTGLGNGFDLRRAGDEPLLIGGGSGASPLLGLARRLLESGVRPRVILGFNSGDELMLLEEFHALGLYPSVTTADGSFGIRGFVTEAMNLPYSFFYTCGPEAMMRAVAEKSPVSGQLSFDARMGCGFGACMGCTRMTVSGPKRVCRDGPVFDKEEIVWVD